MSYPRTRQLVTRSLSFIFFFLFSTFGAFSAFALDPSLDITQYAHTAWKIRDGFIQGTIQAIAQTPDGYLWLGTDSGLYRFDGVRALVWQPPAGQQLPSTSIRSLLVARDGTLWIGTEKGLVSWKNGDLKAYSEMAEPYVASLLEDHEGTVWAGQWGSRPAQLCAIRNGTVECFGKDGSLGLGVLSLYEDRNGNLWAGGGSPGKFGFWRWKPGPPKFYGAGPKVSAQSFVEESDGSLLLAGDGMRRFDGDKIRDVQHLPRSGIGLGARWLLRDREGALWIGTNDTGLFHVHLGKTDKFSEFDGLSGHSVYVIFEDREGDIWVATRDGLDRFRDYVIPTYSTLQGLSTAASGAVLAARNGDIWADIVDGVATLTRGKLTLYRPHSMRDSAGAQLTRSPWVREVIDARVPANGFGAMLEDRLGRIWHGSFGKIGYFQNEQYHPTTTFGTQLFMFDGRRFKRRPVGERTG